MPIFLFLWVRMSNSDLPMDQISFHEDAGWISQIKLWENLDWFKVAVITLRLEIEMLVPSVFVGLYQDWQTQSSPPQVQACE